MFAGQNSKFLDTNKPKKACKERVLGLSCTDRLGGLWGPASPLASRSEVVCGPNSQSGLLCLDAELKLQGHAGALAIAT